MMGHLPLGLPPQPRLGRSTYRKHQQEPNRNAARVMARTQGWTS